MRGINWTEYFDTSWGLRLIHPSQWAVSRQCLDESQYLLIAARSEDNGCQSHLTVRAVPSDSDRQVELETYVDDLVPKLLQSEIEFVFHERGSFFHSGGARCVYVDYSCRPEQVVVQNRVSFVPLDHQIVYAFTFSAAAAAWSRYADIFAHIVDSSSSMSAYNNLESIK